jgi:hypothetical protein
VILIFLILAGYASQTYQEEEGIQKEEAAIIHPK